MMVGKSKEQARRQLHSPPALLLPHLPLTLPAGGQIDFAATREQRMMGGAACGRGSVTKRDAAEQRGTEREGHDNLNDQLLQGPYLLSPEKVVSIDIAREQTKEVMS